MPTCTKCNKHFPLRATVDGKRRNLARRKCCLDCSPFGSPRKTKIENKGSNRTCEVCSRQYIYSHKKGHTDKICNSCAANSRRFLLKKRMINYKGGKCLKCGYNKSYRALDFHHRNKDEKLFNFSGSHCYKWEKIQLELDKCDILCSNCHRETEEMEDLKNKNKEEIVLKYFSISESATKERVCPSCNKIFHQKRNLQTYCSRACYSAYTGNQ